MGSRVAHVERHGDFKLVIGTDPSCGINVGRIKGASPRHAAIRRVGDRIFLRDLHSAQGTFLRGERVSSRRWCEITPDDSVSVSICGSALRITPRVFQGRPRLSLTSEPLTFKIGGGRTLVRDAYVGARFGTLTAIMGPAGCGKSTFLKLLNNYLRPTKGRVHLVSESGQYLDVHGSGADVREFIGYVPQDEIMIPELTVRQSLHCRLALEFPDRDASIRDRLIHRTAESLGFTDPEVRKTYLDTRISRLSGGEKRRANIAHELICQPLVLFLDEPTSGLSSVDADMIVKLLKQLAVTNLITVVAVIHQPSTEAFNAFDSLVLMGHSGELAYAGPAETAVIHFEQATEIPCEKRNPAEYLLEAVTLLQQEGELPAVPTNENETAPSVPGKASLGRRFVGLLKAPFRSAHQLRTLLRRNCRVMWGDLPNLLTTFGQVPVIALLILAAFHSFERDDEAFDRVARRMHFFGQRYDQVMADYSLQPFRADREIRNAISEAEAEANRVNPRISHLAGRRRAAVYFLMVASAIWFGVMGACKEIVCERHVIKREVRSGVALMPHLLAKLLVQVLSTALQTALLAAMVGPWLLRLPAPAVVQLWASLWLAAAAAVCLGLFVSCLAPTYRVALTAVPLLMMPQLLLGGFLRTEVNLSESSPAGRFLGLCTIQRWAFEAALECDPYADERVLDMRLRLPQEHEPLDEFKYVRFVDYSMLEAFFREPDIAFLGCPARALALQSCLLLCIGYVVLRWWVLSH